MKSLEERFYNACLFGHVEDVKALLEYQNLDVHYDNDGAYKNACFNAHKKIVKILLSLEGDRRINVNHSEQFVDACNNKDCPDFIEFMLSLEGDRRINIHYDDDWAFKNACFSGNIEIVKILLKQTGDRKISIKTLNSGFYYACQGHHSRKRYLKKIELVKLLLSLKGDQYINVHSGKEQSFINCCTHGVIEVVNILLALEGDRRINVHAGNESAFRCACSYGQTEVVKLLLNLEGDRRINVHSENDLAFKEACWDGHVDVIKTLLQLEGDRKIDIQSVCRESLDHALSTLNIGPYGTNNNKKLTIPKNEKLVMLLLSLKDNRKIDPTIVFTMDPLLRKRLLVIMLKLIMIRKRKRENLINKMFVGLKKIRFINEFKCLPTGSIIPSFPGGYDYLELVQKY